MVCQGHGVEGELAGPQLWPLNLPGSKGSTLSLDFILSGEGMCVAEELSLLVCLLGDGGGSAGSKCRMFQVLCEQVSDCLRLAMCWSRRAGTELTSPGETGQC